MSSKIQALGCCQSKRRVLRLSKLDATKRRELHSSFRFGECWSVSSEIETDFADPWGIWELRSRHQGNEDNVKSFIKWAHPTCNLLAGRGNPKFRLIQVKMRDLLCLAEYSVWPILASDRLLCLTFSRTRQTRGLCVHEFSAWVIHGISEVGYDIQIRTTLISITMNIKGLCLDQI